MNLFERYLSLWVFLCIVTGITLGHWFPVVFHAIGTFEIAHINLSVALLVWLMVIPMLLKIDFSAIKNVSLHWRGSGVTLLVNWGVKPFSMALLGWFFVAVLFRDYLPESQIDSYIAGLIILAAAPCTAMVFVWSNLMRGEPHFTLAQIALNDVIMIVAFAPIVGFLLGLSNISVPWDTLLLSVIFYIVIPLFFAHFLRKRALNSGKSNTNDGEKNLGKLINKAGPVSLVALLFTLVLLFGLQGGQIIEQPLIILLLAIPITIQVLFTSSFAYWLNRKVGSPHCIAGPSALIGASNFFELAVATAIAMFGFESGAALATVVGVLVEVPVMLLAVHYVNKTRDWYESGEGIVPTEICCPTGNPANKSTTEQESIKS